MKKTLLFLLLIISQQCFAGSIWPFSMFGYKDFNYEHKIISVENIENGKKISSESLYHIVFYLNIEDVYENFYNFSKINIKNDGLLIKELSLSKNNAVIGYYDGQEYKESKAVAVKKRGDVVFSFEVPLTDSGEYSIEIIDKEGKILKSFEEHISVIRDYSYKLVENQRIIKEVFYTKKDNVFFIRVYNSENIKYNIEIYEYGLDFRLINSLSGESKSEKNTYFIDDVSSDSIMGALITTNFTFNKKKLIMENHINYYNENNTNYFD